MTRTCFYMNAHFKGYGRRMGRRSRHVLWGGMFGYTAIEDSGIASHEMDAKKMEWT